MTSRANWPRALLPGGAGAGVEKAGGWGCDGAACAGVDWVKRGVAENCRCGVVAFCEPSPWRLGTRKRDGNGVYAVNGSA